MGTTTVSIVEGSAQMSTIKRILVGLGGTAYTPVEIRYSIELAGHNGAALTAVTVVNTDRLSAHGPVPIGGSGAAHELSEHRLQITEERTLEMIDDFAEACVAAAVSRTIQRETGNPFDLMRSYARYNDLSIFGLRSLFDYGFDIEPNDGLVKLLGAGVRPILAVPDSYRPIRRVMAAYSGSMESAKTLRQFVQLRLWPDAIMRLVHFSSDRSQGESLLADMSAYCNAHGRNPEAHYESGAAEDRILPCAVEWGADLIVLGNSARTLLMRRVLGEASLNVIRNAECALFLSQ